VAGLRDARGEGRKGIGRQHAQDHEPHPLTIYEDRPRKKGRRTQRARRPVPRRRWGEIYAARRSCCHATAQSLH
jgi:hypothetical protein